VIYFTGEILLTMATTSSFNTFMQIKDKATQVNAVHVSGGTGFQPLLILGQALLCSNDMHGTNAHSQLCTNLSLF
jgi:hypothetical protein